MIDFYPSADYVGSPFFSSRQGYAPEAVVLHIAEGTLAGCDSWFNDPSANVSAHFCIGKNGEVHQYTYVSNAAWANGIVETGATSALVAENSGINPNYWTVSIEHEGKTGEEPTAAQFEASAWLSAWLFSNALLPGGATGVAVDRKHILRHAEISPKSRANCPGWTEATMQRYVARVQAILDGPSSVSALRQELEEARRHVDAALALVEDK